MTRSWAMTAGASFLVVLACAEGQGFVALDDQGSRAFVLATRAEGSAPWTILRGGIADQPLVQVRPEDETVLLLFDEEPTALGLQDGSEVRCSVQHPRVTLRLEELDDAWSWASIAEPPESLITALVGNPFRCDPCAPLDASGVSGPTDGRFSGAAWFDESSALVASAAGFARVTESAIDLLPPCAGLSEVPWALASAGDHRFWVGGSNRELALVELSADGSSCRTLSSTMAAVWTEDPRAPNFAALAPRPSDPAAFDLIALRATGEVYRWDASGLRLLARQTDHPEAAEHLFSSIVRPNDELTLTAHGWNEVYVFEGDLLTRVERIPLPPGALSNRPRDRITTLTFDADRDRYLLGSGYGDLWVRGTDQRTWTQFFQSALGDDVGAIWPSYSRYLIFHSGGDVAFVHYEEGSCPSLERLVLSGRSSAHHQLLERDGLILIADAIGAGGRPAGVAWIRERWAPAIAR